MLLVLVEASGFIGLRVRNEGMENGMESCT